MSIMPLRERIKEGGIAPPDGGAMSLSAGQVEDVFLDLVEQFAVELDGVILPA